LFNVFYTHSFLLYFNETLGILQLFLGAIRHLSWTFTK